MGPATNLDTLHIGLELVEYLLFYARLQRSGIKHGCVKYISRMQQVTQVALLLCISFFRIQRHVVNDQNLFLVYYAVDRLLIDYW